MKIKQIVMALIPFLVLSCNGQTTKNIKIIDPTAFAKKINETPKPQIIDVRTPQEFESEHIDNAINVNWNGTDFDAKANTLDKSKPVFVYCKIGGRSAKAALKLEELGFSTIYDLQGGIMKWNAAGFSKPSTTLVGMSVPEYNELLNTDKKVLINFYAEWCAPCKIMTPYMVQMQKDLAHEVVIIRLDADQNKTLINELKISEIPSIMLYENKEIKWKHFGFISEEDLKKQLQ